MANPNAKPKPATLKVRATKPGYIGDGPLGQIYRNEGDVFTLLPREITVLHPVTGKAELDPETNELKTRTLTAHDQFSANWMEVVPSSEPERLTTAQQELNRQMADMGSKS